ncbi:hypothetical protein ACSDQ9_09960 [Aestuariimicrobium soli]|uniref:hypothetical protein n=1 Tax=Aestuariimicrobium soli TaxID=2035834 RepID=UPI003EB9881D
MRDRAEEVPAVEVPDDATREERILANGRHRVEVIKAQREALLDARDDGTFDADVLAAMLANLDSAQIAIEMRTKLST